MPMIWIQKTKINQATRYGLIQILKCATRLGSLISSYDRSTFCYDAPLPTYCNILLFSIRPTPQCQNSNNATSGSHQKRSNLGPTCLLPFIFDKSNWFVEPIFSYVLIGKLPEGSSKINRLSLNRCPPYTEIFKHQISECSLFWLYLYLYRVCFFDHQVCIPMFREATRR